MKEGAEREKIEGAEKEKGQKVCVRERERQNTTDAVSDNLFLSKAKAPVSGP